MTLTLEPLILMISICPLVNMDRLWQLRVRNALLANLLLKRGAPGSERRLPVIRMPVHARAVLLEAAIC